MLTSLEIKRQEFSRAMRGYDAAEVRSYLETVANDFQKLVETVQKHEKALEKLTSELTVFRQMEQNMKEALVTTQETLHRTQEGSKREAELVLKEARLESERIVQEAYRQGDEMRRDFERLQDRRDSLIRKLRHLLRSELELIELLQEDEETGVSSPPQL